MQYPENVKSKHIILSCDGQGSVQSVVADSTQRAISNHGRSMHVTGKSLSIISRTRIIPCCFSQAAGADNSPETLTFALTPNGILEQATSVCCICRSSACLRCGQRSKSTTGAAVASSSAAYRDNQQLTTKLRQQQQQQQPTVPNRRTLRPEVRGHDPDSRSFEPTDCCTHYAVAVRDFPFTVLPPGGRNMHTRHKADRRFTCDGRNKAATRSVSPSVQSQSFDANVRNILHYTVHEKVIRRRHYANDSSLSVLHR